MKRYILFIILIGLLASCTKHGYIDTGVIDVKKHDCSVWEYLHTDSYNWDTLILVIEKAGLQHVFDGTDPDYKEITFFAPTNFSIMKYMYQDPEGGSGGKDDDKKTSGLKGKDEGGSGGSAYRYRYLSEMPAEECRALLLKHVIVGKYMKEDIPERDYAQEEITGYTTFTAVDGFTNINAYTEKIDWVNLPHAGPLHLHIYSESYGTAAIASANIECNNGVVHSMSYGYIFGEL